MLMAASIAVAVLVMLLALIGATDSFIAVAIVSAAGGLSYLNFKDRVESVRKRAATLVEEVLELVREGHYQRAAEMVMEVLEQDPGNDRAYMVMAAMRRSMKDTEGALNMALRNVMENPDSAHAHYHLALAYIEERQPRGGTEELMAALECDEYFLDAYFLLGQIYESERQMEKAARCYEEMVWMSEHWPDGRPYTEGGNLDKAKARLATLEPTLRGQAG